MFCNINFFKISFFVVLLFFGSFIYACTEFLIFDNNQNPFVGRSMEFEKPLYSDIVVVPKGLKKTSYINNKTRGFSWDVKYSYLGITAMGLDILCDGINEKGLSVGVLWFSDVIYPENISSDPSNSIALEDLAAWFLSSFATVEEIKTDISKINVYFNSIPEFGGIPPIHFSIYDRSGNGIVIEYIDEKMVISENNIKVVTNSPKFEWHLTNLREFIHLSPINNDPIKYDNFIINPMGQGTGLYGIPGDWTPPARFVRIAVLKNFAKVSKYRNENIKLGFHLLNTVDIPYGIIRTINKKNYEYTQWAIVKDLYKSKIYYKTYHDFNIHAVDLFEELKNARNKQKKIPMEGTGLMPSRYF